MFSDGYADQFGGKLNRKFITEQFKSLLLDNAHKPMEEQKDILNNTLTKWMGDTNEQLDDIVVIGLKV